MHLDADSRLVFIMRDRLKFELDLLPLEIGMILVCFLYCLMIHEMGAVEVEKAKLDILYSLMAKTQE